jgi:hypothetical protein
LKWIELNLGAFSADAARAYRERGRGAYVATATPGPPKLGPLEYSAPDIGDIAVHDRDMARLVREYNPATQFVVVIREPDDSMHAYTVGIRTT